MSETTVTQLPIIEPIEHKRGDYFEFEFRIGTIDSVTGISVYGDLGVGTTGVFKVRDGETHTDDLIVEMSFDDANIDEGWARFYKSGEGMEVEPGTYSYDAEVTAADGKRRTYYSGPFVVTPEVSDG